MATATKTANAVPDFVAAFSEKTDRPWLKEVQTEEDRKKATALVVYYTGCDCSVSKCLQANSKGCDVHKDCTTCKERIDWIVCPEHASAKGPKGRKDAWTYYLAP